MSEEFLTNQGLKKLKEELEYLVREKRREVAGRIREAVSLGDISENAEYAEAKEEQAFIEGRISEIESVFRNAKIVNSASRNASTVEIGCSVEVRGGAQTRNLMLVGKAEANPETGEISAESPLGRALLGKTAGETVDVHTPAGNRRYTIVRIA
ncbi:MAG: transcription elongation factor GreA [Candidatus Spechtbacteria bacterium RIFCSPHIGHO2_02_FULL_43_15b]|uniref:Transcription elongation factor GreA n=1 Tax=Candidatus Spechtbacteria bacterium RIFCSPHIGHO2_01_FULL_43_30 TaxID=1802158 RepID=A0A1G2H732_9BACT|nr:MAG: transcription elongation factor GreA [Candidatus Spechtbacteria bacterium RIFCSPHIGHO2_01_FULL_43_30]OGZ60331.1 MAG: transcription elongation factor GreA [Candidatus Spechtbacteria bacterium RIFCSPHIGHO2_02_FULL_43_15b]